MSQKVASLDKLYPRHSTPAMTEAMKAFVGAMIVDRGLFRSGKLFYTPQDKVVNDVFRYLDQKFAKKFNAQNYTDFDIDLPPGITHEFFQAESIHLVLPTLDAWDHHDITEVFVKEVIGPLAAWQVIDDLWYIIIKKLVAMLWIFYDSDKKVCWFWLNKYRKFLIEWADKSAITQYNITAYTLEWVVQAEIEQWYINKVVGDPTRWYAYWHLLRANAEFKLFEWARNLFVNWKKYNILATTRWQWKTYLASMVTVRELLKEWRWFWWRKTRMIRYYTPDKVEVGRQVMQYINELIGDMANVVLPNGKKAFDIDRVNYMVTCNITGHIFQITSLHNYSSKSQSENGTAKGEWVASDVVIIDEAARIPNEFWISYSQRAIFETERFFLITTINKETPANHWFYELLVRSETGDLDDSFSLRVTIEENEAMRHWLTDEQWKIALTEVKKVLRAWWDREFYAKWYCIILDESNVFDLWWTMRHLEWALDSDPRIIWFDLAKLDDNAWVVVINLKHRCIEHAIKYSNSSYSMQLDNVRQLKQKYPKSLVIGDRSWVGEVVAEQDTNWVVNAWMKSTASWDLKFNKNLNYWTAPKWYIINTLALCFETWLLSIHDENPDLLQQLKDFIKMKSPHGEVVLYKGKGKTKDDLVLAAAYAATYMYAILWAKNSTEIDMLINNYFESPEDTYNDVMSENSNGANSAYYNNLY